MLSKEERNEIREIASSWRAQWWSEGVIKCLDDLDILHDENERLQTLADKADMLRRAAEEVVRKLQGRIDAALALADTGSQEFKAAFSEWSRAAVVPGWRVTEKMAEVLKGS